MVHGSGSEFWFWVLGSGFAIRGSHRSNEREPRIGTLNTEPRTRNPELELLNV